jgi:hypothetical protein
MHLLYARFFQSQNSHSFGYQVVSIAFPSQRPYPSLNSSTLGGDPLLKSNNPKLLKLHKRCHITRNLLLLLRILGLELSGLLFALEFEEYHKIVAKGELRTGEREGGFACGVGFGAFDVVYGFDVSLRLESGEAWCR